MRAANENRRRVIATGGCLCGSVRYRIGGALQFAGFCYCRDCQRMSGTGRTPFMGFRSETIRFSGGLQTFSSRGGSGQPIERAFCPVCGSRICARPAAATGVTIIYAGTLDEPNDFLPAIAIHCAQSAVWECAGEGLDRFDQGVPSEGSPDPSGS